MYCRYCGSPLNDDDLFCSKCGKSVYANSSNIKLDNWQQSPKNKTLLLIFSILFGYLGIHRFYVGKIGTGILWLFTFGLFGLGWIIDVILIASGDFKDCNGLYIRNWSKTYIPIVSEAKKEETENVSAGQSVPQKSSAIKKIEKKYFYDWDIWDESIHKADGQAARIERAKTQDIKILDQTKNGYAKMRGTSGDIYYVTLEDCTCPDFRRRKIPCKHMYKLAMSMKKRNF